MGRKRNPHTLLVGLQIGTAAMESGMEVPQKTKNWPIIWSSNPSTGYLPQRLENSYPKRYVHTNVHSNIIHSGQYMEATKVSYNRWLDKEACDAMKYYSAIRRDEILPFATTLMDLEDLITLSEISHTANVEKHDHSYVEYKPKSKKWTGQTNRHL